MDQPADQVVLIDENGYPIGSCSRSSVHGRTTPRHLGFSCWIIDTRGHLLMTRRGLNKRSWPGVWTNSCCGHPLPAEPASAAVARRAQQELGVIVEDVECVLPEFSYQAVDASGIVENELCPVFLARITDQQSLRPDPAEVMEWDWNDPHNVAVAMQAAPYAFSAWSVQQLPLLRACDHPSAAAIWGAAC